MRQVGAGMFNVPQPPRPLFTQPMTTQAKNAQESVLVSMIVLRRLFESLKSESDVRLLYTILKLQIVDEELVSKV